MPPKFMPWLLLPLDLPRVIQLVRQNTAKPELRFADVRFISPAFAEHRVARGPPITIVLVARSEHVPMPTMQPELRAVHVPTGRPLAAIRLEAVRNVDHRGILLLRVKMQDLKSNDATTQRTSPEVLTAFQQANELFRGQANVQWPTPRQADVTTFARKGGAIDADDLDALWQDVQGEVRRKVPAGPRCTVVFFVRNLTEMRNNGATLATGVTVPSPTDLSLHGLIAISDLSRAPGLTLAHELGHLCGLDVGDREHRSSRRFPQNLMFKDDNQQRDSLYRNQISLIRIKSLKG
jgi:hypothetical protein